jgi:DNA-binding phage protein
MPSAHADRRFRELCNAFDAVARLELAGAGTSLLARDAGNGRPEVLEVLDPLGKVLEHIDALELLAQARAALERATEQATEHLLAGLALRIRAGQEVNLSAIAREAGLSRQTIYTRLGDLGVNPTP